MTSLPIMIVLSGVICIFIVLCSSTSLAKVTESKSSPSDGTELAFFPLPSSNLQGSNDNCSNCPTNAYCDKKSDRQFCLCKFGYEDYFVEEFNHESGMKWHTWTCKKINCTNDTECNGFGAYCNKDHECNCKPGYELTDEYQDSCYSKPVTFGSITQSHDDSGLGVGIYVLIGLAVLMVVALFVYILIASIPYCTNTNVQAPNYEALKGANYRRNPHYLQEQLPQSNTQESQLENGAIDGSNTEEVAAAATGQKQVSSVGSTGGKAKSKYTKQGFEALLDYYRSV